MLLALVVHAPPPGRASSTVNGTATEKRPSLGVVCLLPICLPDAFRTSTVSFPERDDVPLTGIGLRHCEFGTGVLTTIGDLTGPVSSRWT